jgi:hypothetical protein
MKYLLPLIAAVQVALVTVPAKAQLPLVDITLAANANNELEVKLRPDQAFNGLFSSLVFTVRWETASGASLDVPAQVMPAMAYMPISLSGATVNDGAYTYATYAGFGFAPLSSFSAAWVAGTEYTLATIPVLNGSGVFEVSSDGFTQGVNGSYFVSLNGSDQTGVIYSTSTGVTAGTPLPAGLRVLPNPSEGPVEIRFEAAVPQDLDLEVVNGLGQVVFEEHRKRFSGVYRTSLDLSTHGSGVYILNLRSVRGMETTRIVVR